MWSRSMAIVVGSMESLLNGRADKALSHFHARSPECAVRRWNGRCGGRRPFHLKSCYNKIRRSYALCQIKNITAPRCSTSSSWQIQPTAVYPSLPRGPTLHVDPVLSDLETSPKTGARTHTTLLIPQHAPEKSQSPPIATARRPINAVLSNIGGCCNILAPWSKMPERNGFPSPEAHNTGFDRCRCMYPSSDQPHFNPITVWI